MNRCVRPSSVAVQANGTASMAAPAVRGEQASHDHREDCREERQVRDQRGVHEHGDPRLKAAVDHHHARDPVERAGEIHAARDEPERKRAQHRARGCERDEERREGNPADRRVTEFREAEREERARQDALTRNPGLVLLFLLQPRGHRLGIVPRLEFADANAVHRGAVARCHDVRRIAFRSTGAGQWPRPRRARCTRRSARVNSDEASAAVVAGTADAGFAGGAFLGGAGCGVAVARLLRRRPCLRAAERRPLGRRSFSGLFQRPLSACFRFLEAVRYESAPRRPAAEARPSCRVRVGCRRRDRRAAPCRLGGRRRCHRAVGSSRRARRARRGRRGRRTGKSQPTRRSRP